MTTQFVPTPEYRTLDEWMADSDYHLVDGVWHTEYGTPVDALEVWQGAMEAAGTEYLVVEVDVETGAYRLLDHDGNLLREPGSTDTLANNQAWTFGLRVADLLDVDTAVYSGSSVKPTRAEYLAKKEARRG